VHKLKTDKLPPKGEREMAKKAWVDQDACISCGLCVDNLPDVFRFDDSGKAVCFDPSGASETEIQEQAIDICPVSCISWQD
jgi:ferredoxin